MMRVMMSCVMFFASCGSAWAQVPRTPREHLEEAYRNSVQKIEEQLRDRAMLPRVKGKAFSRLPNGEVVKDAVSLARQQAYNEMRRNGRIFSETYGRGFMWAAMAADHVPDFLLNAEAGKYQEAAVVVGNAIPEELTVGAGGVIVGDLTIAGLSMLGVGGLAAGAPITVPLFVGGAVGGWLGAVGTGMLYDVYAKDSVKDFLRSVIPSEAPTDAFEQAVESRKEFLAEEAERTGNRDKESEFYTRLAAIERERESRRQQELAEQSKSFLSAPGADNPDRWKDLESRAKRLAKEAAENPIVKKDADPDTIPEVAVIDAVFVGSNETPLKWTLFLRGDTVTGLGEFKTPGINNKEINGVIVNMDGVNSKYQFEGAAQDNIISGSSTIDLSPQSHSAKLPDGSYRRTRRTYTKQNQELTFTLHTDGTVTMAGGPTTGEYRFQVLEGRGEKEAEITVEKFSSDITMTMTGVWQYRQTAKVTP